MEGKKRGDRLGLPTALAIFGRDSARDPGSAFSAASAIWAASTPLAGTPWIW